jgi:hypothetical protein
LTFAVFNFRPVNLVCAECLAHGKRDGDTAGTLLGLDGSFVSEIVGHGADSLACANEPMQRAKIKIEKVKTLFIRLG